MALTQPYESSLTLLFSKNENNSLHITPLRYTVMRHFTHNPHSNSANGFMSPVCICFPNSWQLCISGCLLLSILPETEIFFFNEPFVYLLTLLMLVNMLAGIPAQGKLNAFETLSKLVRKALSCPSASPSFPFSFLSSSFPLSFLSVLAVLGTDSIFHMLDGSFTTKLYRI